MANLNKDLEYVQTILDGQNQEQFGFIYSRTNENLLSLFEKINVTGKKVYTVLSSGDFLFSAVNAGASVIDCFDVNPITYRYYHLRKWLLQYNLIDADGQYMSTLKYIVKNHLDSDCLNEQDSVTFWLDFLSKIDNFHFYSNILFEYMKRPKVPYSENLKAISEKLKLMYPRFDYVDICANLKNNQTRKYDLVYLSNILYYNRQEEKLKNCCHNILNILEENGEVICSSIRPDAYYLDKEHDIFSDYFHYDEIFTDKFTDHSVLYYKYTKK